MDDPETTADGEHPDVVRLHAEVRQHLRDELLGDDSFVPVLVLVFVLLALLVLGPDHVTVRIATTMLAVIIVMLTARRARVHPRTRRVMDVIALVIGALSVTQVLASEGWSDSPEVIAFGGSLLLAAVILMSVPAILRRVLVSRKVTISILAGALVAYLLIGLFFALTYAGTAVVVEPFFTDLSDPTTADVTYFSYITITTVGYGDLSPVAGAARSLAVLEAIIGQVFLVTIVARVVSNMGADRTERFRSVTEAAASDSAQLAAEERDDE